MFFRNIFKIFYFYVFCFYYHVFLFQVIAAATFGNFLNPESVRDLPLICYAHDGFGILKNFLNECREQATTNVINSKKSSSVSPGVVVKEWAKRHFKAGNNNIEMKEEEIRKEDKIVEEIGEDVQIENPKIGIILKHFSKNKKYEACFYKIEFFLK
jgi:DNA repair photolyase